MSWLVLVFAHLLYVHSFATEKPTLLDVKETAQQWVKSRATLPTLLRVLDISSLQSTAIEQAQLCAPPELTKELNGLRVTLHPLEVSLIADSILQGKPLCSLAPNPAAITFPLRRPSWYDPGEFSPTIDQAIVAATRALLKPKEMHHTYKGRSLATLLSLVVAFDPIGFQSAALIVYPSPDDASTSMMVKRVSGSDPEILQRLHPSLSTLPDEPLYRTTADDTPDNLVRTFDARVKGAGRNQHDWKAVEELAHALIGARVGGVEREWAEVGRRTMQLRKAAPAGSPRALGSESWNELSADLVFDHSE